MIASEASVLHFDEIDSTNAEAARRAAAGDHGPLWISADRQTQGRGRRGRSWTSEPGNVFLTYLGATSLPPGELALLSFAAALAVADLTDDAFGASVARVKWPNDVLVGGAKIAGILLESGAIEPGRFWIAVGVGVNIATAPEDLGRPVARLSTAPGGGPAPAIAAATLRSRLVFWAQLLESHGFAQLRTAWRARAFGLGEVADVQFGTERISGRARDLDAQGALVLELSDGTLRSISAGEVNFPDLSAT